MSCDKCTNGHIQTEKGWKRCECLETDIRRRLLGQMYADRPVMDTSLINFLDKDLVLEGPLASLREHIAGALIYANQRKQSWHTIDAYRLIEIFLQKDDTYETSQPLVEADLLVMLLGFADPRNAYLPELILQVLSRRELNRKPTWIVLGLPKERIEGKYSSAQLGERIKNIKTAKIQ